MDYFWSDILRTVIFFIDVVVYWLVGVMYKVFFQIAQLGSLFEQDIIDNLLTRIYSVMVVFMVFKIVVSFITYITDPEKMADKGNGIGKLVTNIVITLVLIWGTPLLFRVALQIQTDIVTTNIIPSIIFGSDTTTGNSNDVDKILITTLWGSVFYDKENPDDPKNIDGSCADASGIAGCADDITRRPGGGDYKYEYKVLLSTVIGLLIGYLLILFSIDIAKRAVKLALLEVISPIFIVSYIDPQSAKNGLFSRWVKQVAGTYFDLFARLLAIFFAIFIVKLVNTSTTLNALSGFAKIFVIMGAFLFAKGITQFISDLTGIKMDGGKETSGLLKAAAGFALGAGVVGAGALASGTANVMKGISDFRKDKSLKSFGNIIGSGFGGFAGGLKAGVTGYDKKKGIGANFANITGTTTAKRNYRDKIQGLSMGDRAKYKMDQFMGKEKTSADDYIKQQDLLAQQYTSQADSMDSSANLYAQQNGIDSQIINDFSSLPYDKNAFIGNNGDIFYTDANNQVVQYNGINNTTPLTQADKAYAALLIKERDLRQKAYDATHDKTGRGGSSKYKAYKAYDEKNKKK